MENSSVQPVKLVGHESSTMELAMVSTERGGRAVGSGVPPAKTRMSSSKRVRSLPWGTRVSKPRVTLAVVGVNVRERVW